MADLSMESRQDRSELPAPSADAEQNAVAGLGRAVREARERAPVKTPPTEPDQKPDRPGTDRESDSPPQGGWFRSKFALLYRHPYLSGAAALLLLAIVIGGVIWWLHARHFESTNDAFVDARTVPVSSQVVGAITEVLVTDNQPVEANAVLLQIDPRDYQAQAAQANAQVDQAKAAIENLEAQTAAEKAKIEAASKQVLEAQAAFKFAQQENQRYQDLVARGAGTEQRAQQAASDLRQRQAALDAAEANAKAEEAQLGVLSAQRQTAEAQLEAARAQLDQAQANLSRTRIRASVAGRVAKLSAAKGAYATPGQVLMMIVPRELWITANFKETQLAQMRPGQPVTISIDAYGGREFHGHVDSIQSGSGTAFSILPAENATGNFVKIVQRVPVKIVFDEQPDVLLGPGMSVVVSVKVR